MSLLSDFEEYLQKSFPKIESFHPHYDEAFSYMLKAGGKRFRPMLLLGVVEAKAPLLVKNAMPVAAAVEYLHTYSLVHDDLPSMDNADLRRGKKTLHKAYNETLAILIGDALNTYSFYLISKAPLDAQTKIELVEILSMEGGAHGMVLGQAIDCHYEEIPLSLKEVEFLHIHKTGRLIAASLSMGGVIANLPQKEVKDLYNFGIELGLLFQIQDDLIDAVADESVAKKTTGNDSNKNSFVNLLGIEGAFKAAEEKADLINERLENFDERLQKGLKELLKDYITRHERLRVK